MYIQITNRCNMECPHCCFRCTKEGDDMSMKTWENVKNKLLRGEEFVVIGGGEPTLHKYFNTFLMDCITEYNDVFIVTNGTNKKLSMMLAKLTQKGAIRCELSVDHYHDMTMVDPEVLQIFIKMKSTRTVTSIANVGRALDNNEYTDNGCGCGGLIIKPNGDVFQCNCPDATYFGNVNSHNFALDDYHGDICMRDIERED